MNVGIWGWDYAVAPNTPQWRQVHLDRTTGNLQVDVAASALPALAATAANQATIIGHIDGIEGALGQCYGWDGGEWLRMLFEADDVQNLRVKLFDGANGIDSDQLDSNIFVSGDRGILTRSQVCGYNLEPFHQRRTDVDALATVSRELCQMNIALLYGYNGSTFDRLRTESSTAFNLRVRLYAGANEIFAVQGDTSIQNQWGLVTKATLYAQRAADDIRVLHSPSADVDDVAAARPALITAGWLYGFNGAAWDRLRTYGTGVLKVGRAEIGLSTSRLVATGQVKAAPGQLYWVHETHPAGNGVWELSDDLDGSTAIVIDHFSTIREGHLTPFDPPIEFSTGIYLKTFTNLTSIVFGYK